MPHPIHHPIRACWWLVNSAFSVVCLTALLTVAAAIPGLNLYAFGYLLEAQGRVARTGRLRRALPLLPVARRLALILLAMWLWLLPVQLLAEAARDVWLLAPGTITAWLWIALLALTGTIVATHLILAVSQGGGWWCFFRPIKNIRWLLARCRAGDFWDATQRRLAEIIAALRVAHHVKLGLFGYAGTYAWLLVPTFMFTFIHDASRWWQRPLLILGGLLLALVLTWLPFLQAQFAAEGRLAAIWNLRAVRQRFRNAPSAWLFAGVVLFGLSVLVPLYQSLLKPKLPLYDTRWDVMLVAIVVAFPGRILVGWAYHRSGRRRRIWWTWQWVNRLLLAAVTLAFVAFLMFAATSGQLGQRVIWQHHALVPPLPF